MRPQILGTPLGREGATEPQLHVQLMDHPWVAVAAGLPVEFENFEVDGQRRSGVPRNGEPFVVASPRS